MIWIYFFDLLFEIGFKVSTAYNKELIYSIFTCLSSRPAVKIQELYQWIITFHRLLLYKQLSYYE